MCPTQQKLCPTEHHSGPGLDSTIAATPGAGIPFRQFSSGIEENKERKENRHVCAPWARFMVRMKRCKKQKGEEEKELRKGGRKEVGGQRGGREKGKERRQHMCRRRPDFIL